MRRSIIARREAAAQFVLDFVVPGLSVGLGGSATIKELGIPEQAREKGAVILDHSQPDLSPEERQDVRRKQLVCDLFLSSTNAITLDGSLVNVDGGGNRVAALSFGPKKVIVVAGVNKICCDEAAAFERIRTHAAPMNNRRLGLANPCVAAGVCMNCRQRWQDLPHLLRTEKEAAGRRLYCGSGGRAPGVLGGSQASIAEARRKRQIL